MSAPVTSRTPEAIPTPRWRLPIIGDLLTIDMQKPCQSVLGDLSASGGILEQRIFDFRGVAISRVDLVDDVNDENHWEKSVGHALRKLRPLAGDGLFTAYNNEPNWHKAHNILMPTFTKAAMASYHPAMLNTVGELIETWSSRAGTWIDVLPATTRLTTEVVARVGVGHSFNHLSDTDNHPFIATVLRELAYANRRTDAIPHYDITLGLPRHLRHLRDISWLRQEVSALIERRRADAATPWGANMLDTMLHTADPDTGEKLDDANIINQVLTLLVAGSETTANAVAFALHLLATHPDIAAVARTEVNERLAGRTFAEITFDDVAPLRYLRRIIDETLRLWPTAPGYFRRARHDTTIGDGRYQFAAGDTVFVMLLAAHRDPGTWGSDASEFNPDRFRSENLRKLGPYIYKPFGTGMRACIGRQFALHEIMLTLATVLHHFDIEPEPGYTLQVGEAMSLRPQGLRLRMHERR